MSVDVYLTPGKEAVIMYKFVPLHDSPSSYAYKTK